MPDYKMLFGCPGCNATGSVFNQETGDYILCDRCDGKGVLMFPKENEPLNPIHYLSNRICEARRKINDKNN